MLYIMLYYYDIAILWCYCIIIVLIIQFLRHSLPALQGRWFPRGGWAGENWVDQGIALDHWTWHPRFHCRKSWLDLTCPPNSETWNPFACWCWIMLNHVGRTLWILAAFGSAWLTTLFFDPWPSLFSGDQCDSSEVDRMFLWVCRFPSVLL